MISKNKFIMAGIVLFIGVMTATLVIGNQSPYAYLQKHDGTTRGTTANEFIEQDQFEEDRYAIFFLNSSGNLSCAILKKTLISYELLEISAEVSLSDKSASNYLFSSYKDGKIRRWIDWGVIQSPKIKSVLIDGQEATIVDVQPYDFRICYQTGQEREQQNPPNHVELSR